MQQIDQQQQGLVTHQGQTQLVQIGNQFYRLTEIYGQPVAIDPPSITQPVPYQPQPTVIHPTALPPQENQWSWQMVALMGMGVLIVTGFGTFLIVKAAIPPAPAPVVVPPAPPPPAPVIIQQAPPPPPPPPPTLYKRTNCKPAGIFGGEVCSTEEGFVR